MVESVTSILSPEQLLSRAKAAASKVNTAGLSAVGKLLAGREDTEEVSLSPVQKLAEARKAEAEQQKIPYTEQDWYINLKVTQLRFQLDFYSKLGGQLGQQAMSSIEKEIKGLLQKQADKVKKTNEEADALQKQLAEQEAAAKALVPSPEEFLQRAEARARGEFVPEFSAEGAGSDSENAAVQALLDKAKESTARGSTVNTTA